VGASYCPLTFSVPSVGAGAPEPDRGLQEPGSHQLSGHGESPSHYLMAKILRYWHHKSSIHGLSLIIISAHLEEKRRHS